MATNTQLVNERLALAEQAASQGNFAAAITYANAALGYSRSASSLQNINNIISAYTNAYAQQQRQPGAPAPTGGTPTGTSGGGSTGSPTDWQKKYFEDQQRAQQDSIIAVMRDFMAANGMGDLLAGLEKYVRAGYSGDSVYVMLKNDPQYQQAYQARFSANAGRRAAGLPELSPAAYIEMENGYRSAMMSRGMPSGLFDSPDDFKALLERDVSVREVEARLDSALEYINYSGNAEVKRQLRELYGMSDGQMAAYVLDPSRTLDFLQREVSNNVRRASVGGAAVNSGVGVSAGIRDQIAELLAAQSGEQAYATSMTGFANVAEQDAIYEKLGDLSGVDTSTDELVTEQFSLAGAGEVTNKKKLLASQERARFSGMSGVGSTSLSAGRRAQ